MKKKNGFTLIELLAIIVILAIIAVITIPIILNVIDNSKKGAAIDSAYGYRDAIHKYYMSKMLDDSSYVIENGEHDVLSYINEGLDVSGEKPSQGWVMIENGEVTDFSIKIGDYIVTYNSSTNTTVAEKGSNVALTPTQEKAQIYLTSLKTAKGNVSDVFNLPVEGVSSTGVTSGWVALDNGEVIGYSLQVGDKTTTLSSKNDSIESIVKTLATTYLDSLQSQTSETVVDVTESGKLKSGFIEYKSNGTSIVINDYSLKYEVDGVTKYANYVSNQLTIQDVKRNKPIAGVVDTTDGAKYYTGAQVTYYNPGSSTVSAGPCTEALYNSNTDKNGTTGCLKWYAYSEKGNYVNMILDHNVNAGCTGDACKWAASDNSAGPVLALSTLDSYTSSWQTETPKVPNKYGTGGAESNPQIVPATANNNQYPIDYGSYKARLITYEELLRIKSANSNSLPSKLYGNLPANSNVPYGYWTSSPSAGDSRRAWCVYYIGSLNLDDVNRTTNYGVRPVITVSNS